MMHSWQISLWQVSQYTLHSFSCCIHLVLDDPLGMYFWKFSFKSDMDRSLWEENSVQLLCIVTQRSHTNFPQSSQNEVALTDFSVHFSHFESTIPCTFCRNLNWLICLLMQKASGSEFRLLLSVLIVSLHSGQTSFFSANSDSCRETKHERQKEWRQGRVLGLLYWLLHILHVIFSSRFRRLVEEDRVLELEGNLLVVDIAIYYNRYVI